MNRKLAPFYKARNNINFEQSNSIRESLRIYLIPFGFLIALFLLIGRLFHLTVVKGTYYKDAAENNRIKEIVIEGSRGDILDRHNKEIAFSEKNPPLKKDQAPEFKRKYSYGEALGNLIGYRQKASQEDFISDACEYKLMFNDKIGRFGIENIFECHIRPKKGKKLIEIDAMGTYLKTMSEVDPVDGKSVKLALDADLQQYIYKKIKNNEIHTTIDDLSEKHLAVVALDPHTGEVIMLLSYPSFNSQDFEDEKKDAVRKYVKDINKPLFSRALQGVYPPGSVFKPIVATAGLEEKVISPTDTITDNGFIEAGPIQFRNWLFTKYGRTDGQVDMIKGLQRSNDIYFYKLGEKLTYEHLRNWSEKFGLGHQSGIALSDVTGLVPSDFWKQEKIGERWFLGDTYNMSIGQGYLLVTPIQMAKATTVFANGGKLCTPQLLKLDAYENRLLLSSDKPQCKNMDLQQKTLDTVREGMKRACEAGGTGYPFFEFMINGERMYVGCKTGTAESHGVDKHPHAWFTIFAPFDNPKIVVTVMVENGGEGSDVAAPIAKEVLTKFFSE